MTQQLYFDDVLCLEFQAEVTEIFPGEDGKVSVVLPRTYFYPTSGGQDHDTGKIGDAIVLEVYKGTGNKIIHVLDREILPGMHPASIDHERRWQNMQAHTAQHILSRAFELVLNLETLSANINFDNPSTIDLDAESILEREIDQLEKIANAIVFENRQVKNYYITDKDISRIPFRKPPKVSGRIRVVEVDGFDYSACGGTHCPQTGMVGLIKILKIETQNRKLRVHFVAGTKALEVFQTVYHTIKKISGVMDTSISDLEISVQRRSEVIDHLREELVRYKSKLLTIEAAELFDSSFQVGNLKVITKLYSDKLPEDLRKLVNIIRSENGILIILAGLDGKKLSMVVGCSQNLQLDARRVLDLHLERYNGHGGGDQHLAQGGCIISDKNEVGFFNETINLIQKNFLTG
ncbi:MAG: DHHA1 domain-containing protein [Chloroflexota bacterium]